MNESPEPIQNAAVKALLDGRADLAETRLAVTAAQIVERLRIRGCHVRQLLDEELELDSRLNGIGRSSAGGTDMMNLENLLKQQIFQTRSAQRREETECWRDLANVIRDLLNAWEGYSRTQAKNRFLSALPGPANGSARHPSGPAPDTYQNDHYQPINNHR